MPRTCPDCDVALVSEPIQGVEIDRCPDCGGVWFDDNELHQLTYGRPEVSREIEAEFTAPLEAKAADKVRNCPACQTVMEEFRYLYDSPITLDSCPACYGIWVENGELNAMSDELEKRIKACINPAVLNAVKEQWALAELEDERMANLARHQLFQRVARIFSLRRPYRI